jgi:hypothetical protein
MQFFNLLAQGRIEFPEFGFRDADLASQTIFAPGDTVSCVSGHTPEGDFATEEFGCLRDILDIDGDTVVAAGTHRGIQEHRDTEGDEAKSRGLANRWFDVE